jgi:hypothetical protein
MLMLGGMVVLRLSVIHTHCGPLSFACVYLDQVK